MGVRGVRLDRQAGPDYVSQKEEFGFLLSPGMHIYRTLSKGVSYLLLFMRRQEENGKSGGYFNCPTEMASRFRVGLVEMKKKGHSILPWP